MLEDMNEDRLRPTILTKLLFYSILLLLLYGFINSDFGNFIPPIILNTLCLYVIVVLFLGFTPDFGFLLNSMAKIIDKSGIHVSSVFFHRVDKNEYKNT